MLAVWIDLDTLYTEYLEVIKHEGVCYILSRTLKRLPSRSRSPPSKIRLVIPPTHILSLLPGGK